MSPDPLTARLLADAPHLSPERAARMVQHLRTAIVADRTAWREVAATARASAARHQDQARRLLALAHLLDAALAEATCRAR